jgi:hypothetical protein
MSHGALCDEPWCLQAARVYERRACVRPEVWGKTKRYWLKEAEA